MTALESREAERKKAKRKDDIQSVIFTLVLILIFLGVMSVLMASEPDPYLPHRVCFYQDGTSDDC